MDEDLDLVHQIRHFDWSAGSIPQGYHLSRLSECTMDDFRLRLQSCSPDNLDVSERLGYPLLPELTPFSFAFPSLLMAPPYLFGAQGVGLIEIAAIIGIVIACFGGGILCDLITSYKIHKEGNRFYPEQRLWSIIPGFWIAPVGCIVVAICCSEKLSWIGIAFGFGMRKLIILHSCQWILTLQSYCQSPLGQYIYPM